MYFFVEEQKQNCLIKNKLAELLNNNSVKFYSSKIALFSKLNNIKDCVVCYSNKLHIDFVYGHDVCIDCYCSMTICQFRC